MRRAIVILACLSLSGCDPAASADQGRNHRIQPGESLFSIAEEAYGNGLEWPRIWEANPWIDPDRLQAGDLLYVPPMDDSWGDPRPPPQAQFSNRPNSPRPAYAQSRTRVSGNPSNGSGIDVFHNLGVTIRERTLFGIGVEKALLFLLLCFLLHASIQSLLVWIAANITFVKEVTFKKSMKAVFLTEMITFTTLVVLLMVGILLVYIGTDPSAVGGGGNALFPALEDFLHSPTGVIVAGLALLVLYVTLSLRFLPQVFNVPLSHGITLMAISILIPHLVGFYLIGQRTGLIS
jgi:hypothetical protein